MPEPSYRVVPQKSRRNCNGEQFSFALLDPNGLVVARGTGPRPAALIKQMARLQEAFDLGRQWSYAAAIARFNNMPRTATAKV